MELDAKTMKKLSKNPTLMAQIANLQNTITPLDENLSPAKKLRLRINHSSKSRSSKVSKEYLKEKRIKKEQDKLAKEQANAPKPEDTVKDIVSKTKTSHKNKLKKLQAKYGTVSDAMYKDSMSELLKENLNDDDRHHHNNIIQLYLKQNPVSSEVKKITISDDSSEDESQ